MDNTVLHGDRSDPFPTITVTKNSAKKKTKVQHGTPFMGLWTLEPGSNWGYLIAPDIVSYSTRAKTSTRSFPEGTKYFLFFFCGSDRLFVFFLGAMWCECNAVFFRNGHIQYFPSSYPPSPPPPPPPPSADVGKIKPRVRQRSTEVFRLCDQLRSVCMEIEPSTVKHTA